MTKISAGMRGYVDQYNNVRELLKAIDEQFQSSDKALASTLIIELSSLRLTSVRGYIAASRFIELYEHVVSSPLSLSFITFSSVLLFFSFLAPFSTCLQFLRLRSFFAVSPLLGIGKLRLFDRSTFFFSFLAPFPPVCDFFGFDPSSRLIGLPFAYGGEDIGSEESLTILNIEWSAGLVQLKCVERADFTPHGSFADVIITPKAHEPDNYSSTSLFILTNLGQLHFIIQQCPLWNHMTVGKLYLMGRDRSFFCELSEFAPAKLQEGDMLTGRDSRWPLTGGVSLSSVYCCK
ncbi:uncharacterized protein LOC142530467 [Primulina tabacum]|uniref:uncharacterized protein LOC142530467 n=1 Tax=Primulina tabacum TaxID=48773 RepID=UPI003F59EE66